MILGSFAARSFGLVVVSSVAATAMAHSVLRRGDRVVVPRGFTRVEPGDILTLITTREHEEELRGWVARVEG